jgi:antirestriction protein ArdC
MLLKDTSKSKNHQELVKASIDALVKALEAGHSEVLSSYLTAMAQFHNYSFQNIILIASQRPTATKVAGIRTWNELGRRVRRGEKGIMIFAPLIGYQRNASETEPSQQSDARTDKPESRLVGFRAVYVFDVAQTEGEELPELSSTVSGAVGDKLDRLIAFTETQAIKLEFSDAIAPARGMSYGDLIRILPELAESETFATLIHELAHEMLHKAERRTMTTKAVRETEAEAVAFVVCHALGLETGTGSSDYIQLFHGDANLLKESLEVVQRTSNVILEALCPKDVPPVPPAAYSGGAAAAPVSEQEIPF